MSEVGKLLIATITDADPAIRDRSVRELVSGSSVAEKIEACADLEQFRRARPNLYERVRASLFLHALYRYEIQDDPAIRGTGHIPFAGFMDLMERRYEPAIASFLETMKHDGPNGAICSALAQVLRADRVCDAGRPGAAIGQELPGQSLDVSGRRGRRAPLRIHHRLLERVSDEALFPILVEKTAVRLDLSHSGWSDIFFLGMDFPEGARVLNISVDLGVHGRDPSPTPPIETRLRVITEPILRLTSIDLNACKDVDSLEELFNFGNDYLGLIKAAVVASGLVPPSLEGTHSRLSELLGRIVRKGTRAGDRQQGQRHSQGIALAVSTNLLASLIALLMRATGQTRNLTGPLESEEAKVVVARAILGEWMGGSGGGWQDSGGIFPGIKLIEGVAAEAGDPEWGVSRGRLLPTHSLLNAPSSRPSGPVDAHHASSLPAALPRAWSWFMGVWRKTSARSSTWSPPSICSAAATSGWRGPKPWRSSTRYWSLSAQPMCAARQLDHAQLGRPAQAHHPVGYQRVHRGDHPRSRQALGEDFWGFLMLGGMSGGGMAFFVAPHRHDEFQDRIAMIMKEAKATIDDALPFAMEPVVYDFRINAHGTFATLDTGDTSDDAAGVLHASGSTHDRCRGHVGLAVSSPGGRRPFRQPLPGQRRAASRFPHDHQSSLPCHSIGRRCLAGVGLEAARIRRENGFDRVQHEQLRDDLQRGRIGLARNRLPVDLDIRDVDDSELIQATEAPSASVLGLGESALRRGEVAVVTLPRGVGSRWTTGAGVVKAVNPFVDLDGRHRGFLEIHLAKTRKTQREFNTTIPHIVTTSYLTHSAIERHSSRRATTATPAPFTFHPAGRSVNG